MARKNPFANLMETTPADEGRVALDYTIKGASKSILSSINEMASQADKLLEGETVVEIAPADIDVSFVRDRMADDDAEFEALVEAIGERGQDSPVLLRPHPSATGRYMVVFGHRRVRAAERLGRKVRAVIKQMDDRAHVIAQGQENSARANLSFIERAVFAERVARLAYDNDNRIVMTALAVDRSTLSKMLSVTAIPGDVLEAIGAAKGIGRDRWYEMKQLLEKPSRLEQARAVLSGAEMAALSSDERFNRLVTVLKASDRPAKAKPVRNSRSWSAADKAVAADISSDGRRFTLALKARDAIDFGEFLSDRLPDLYAAFRKEKAGQ